MFGSIGWGVCMFVMGIVLDNSTIFPTHRYSSICTPNTKVLHYMYSLQKGTPFCVLPVLLQYMYSLQKGTTAYVLLTQKIFQYIYSHQKCTSSYVLPKQKYSGIVLKQ